MAIKIYISGAFLISEDSVTREPFFKIKKEGVHHLRNGNDQFAFFKENNLPHLEGQPQLSQLGIQPSWAWDSTELQPAQKTQFDFNEIVDSSGIAYLNADTLDDYLNENLGFFFNSNSAGGSAFITTTPLASLAVYDSGVLDMRSYTQVQTEILSSHDGTLDFIFYSDAGGTDAVRSLSIPYLASIGFQLLSAPTFGYYVRYKFTNTSVSTQTDFFYTTKFRTTSISGQITTLTGGLAEGMVANVGRNVIVGQDRNGNFVNVHATVGGDIASAITDASLGFHAIVTAGGGLKVNESTHLVGEPFGGASLNTIEWDIDLVGSGTQDASGVGELVMNTGTTANSAVEINSADVARFIPANYNTTHHAITIPDGASYIADNKRKWGAIEATDMVNCNGIYFELDSGSWYVVHCKNGVATRVIQASWNGIGADQFPTNSITANVYEIEYNAGSAVFRVNGNVIHRFNLTLEPFANNVHFPVGMCNTNYGGSIIDVSLKVRASAIYTLGKGRGQSRPYYISNTNAGVIVKTGAGHLDKVIFTRSGAGGGNASVSIYDGLSAVNQVGLISVDNDVTETVIYDFTFNIGLFIVVSGAGTLGTTITFD